MSRPNENIRLKEFTFYTSVKRTFSANTYEFVADLTSL